MKKIAIACIIVVCLAVGLFVVGRNFSWFQKDSGEPQQVDEAQNSPSTDQSIKKQSNQPTADGYATAIADSLRVYLALRETVGDYSFDRLKKEAPSLHAAREKLFFVTVPAESRDSHLALMLALTRIDEGMVETEAHADHAVSPLWEKGEKDLDAFIKTYGPF